MKLIVHEGKIDLHKLLQRKEGTKIEVTLDDDIVDVAGYLGTFNRTKAKLEPCSWDELVQVLEANEQTQNIMRRIKTIDKDHNGYVTLQELDDIIKVCCPELLDRKLDKLFQRFSDPITKVLIDYRKLRVAVDTDIRAFKIDKAEKKQEELRAEIFKSHDREEELVGEALRLTAGSL